MITIEFKDFAEVKEFARELLAGEIGTATAVSEVPKKTKEQKPELAKEIPEAAAVEEPEAESKLEPEAESEVVTEYSLEDVRGKLAALNKAGKRKEVTELLASFGVSKLSAVPEELYTELMKKAEGI